MNRAVGGVAVSLLIVAGIALVVSLVIAPWPKAAENENMRMAAVPESADHGHMSSGMRAMHMENATPGPTAIPGARDVRITAANFSFAPSDIRLPKNADVNLTLTNPASTGVVHDLVVPALDIHLSAEPGETQTIGLRRLAPGRYDAYCAVPGHIEMGMRATVIVG